MCELVSGLCTTTVERVARPHLLALEPTRPALWPPVTSRAVWVDCGCRGKAGTESQWFCIQPLHHPGQTRGRNRCSRLAFKLSLLMIDLGQHLDVFCFWFRFFYFFTFYFRTSQSETDKKDNEVIRRSTRGATGVVEALISRYAVALAGCEQFHTFYPVTVFLPGSRGFGNYAKLWRNCSAGVVFF